MRKNTKIRALSLLLALLMVLGLLPGTAMAAEGEDAILISTAEELAAFRDRVNSGENVNTTSSVFSPLLTLSRKAASSSAVEMRIANTAGHY